MVKTARFTLPETHAAYRRWQEITGLDEASAEWGEVWTVLGDAGLLDADRCPQRSLFDDPETPLGDTRGARRLRLAVIGGAQLWRQHNPGEFIGLPPLSDGGLREVATCTAAVAALLDQHYSELAEYDVELGLTQLEIELPRRQLRHMASPGAALGWQLSQLREVVKHIDPQVIRDRLDVSEAFVPLVSTRMGQLVRSDVVAVVVREARRDDAFAVRVFDQLARELGVALAPMVDGSWLLYRNRLTEDL